MDNSQKKQSILDAVAWIRSAEQLLINVSRASSDPATLMKINTEYGHLDSYLSQLLHAQAIADDNDFNAAAHALTQQVAILAADDAEIRQVVADVAIAAKIVGYIAQAVALIAKL